MTITCSYSTWNHRVDKYSLTLEQCVTNALILSAQSPRSEYSDEEINAVIDAYRDAINAALPDSVSLCGDQFYGPYIPAVGEFYGYPHDSDGDLDIGEIVAQIDFWAIVEQVTTA